MKIGFDAKRLFQNKTGLGNYSRTLVRNLQHFFPDNDYFLCTPNTGNSPECTEFTKPPYQIITPSHPFKAYWRTRGLTKELINKNLNIYHGLSHEIPMGLNSATIKTVVTIHDLIFKTHPNTYKPIDRFIYDKKWKYSCQNADAIVAISESTKNDLLNYYNLSPEKITVIYQPCQPLFYQMQPEKNLLTIKEKYQLPNDFLLYVGSLQPRKNLLNLIKAYSQLPKNSQIPLVLVGNGRHYKTKIQQLIKSKQLAKNIICLENLSSNDHLQAIYQLATILVYPSLYEGFGLPIVEAMLSKTAVITSNISSMPEAGGDYAWYINPESPAEIAATISEVLENDQERTRCIALGYTDAQRRFSINKLTNEMMNLYQKIG